MNMCDEERNCSVRLKAPTMSPLFTNTIESDTNSGVSANNAFNFASTSNCQLAPISSGGFNLSEYYRLQFYNYASQASLRLRLNQPAFAATQAASYSLPNAYPSFGDGTPFAAISPFARFDSRFRFIHEEPKPQHSYIGLIAMAILSSVEQKMVLSDIYQHILDNYPYFRNRGPGWRNSIRHNLSLNDCFVKAGRSANGKGHYWAIHPANIEDFKKGDFRRRKAQRKVRKHMGLSVADEDDSPSPTPPPLPNLSNAKTNIFGSSSLMAQTGVRIHSTQLNAIYSGNPIINDYLRLAIPANKLIPSSELESSPIADQQTCDDDISPNISVSNIKTIKRQFDVESLLAPDRDCDSTPQTQPIVNHCISILNIM